MADILPFGHAPDPHKRYTVETLAIPFGGSALQVAFSPPIEVWGMDLSRDGSLRSLGRLAARHVMSDDASPALSELPHNQRSARARETEVEINDVLSGDFQDEAQLAGAIYEAFLRVGVLAVVLQPDSFVKGPDA